MSSSAAAFVLSPRLYDPQQVPRGTRIKTLCEMYCREHPQISGVAAQQYRVAANLCRRWMLSRRKRTFLDEIFTLEHFLDFAKWLSEGRSPSTINGRIDTLWMLWSFAEDENLADARPPAKKKPRWREPKRDPVAFAIDQIVQLMAAAMKAPPMRRCPWWTPDFWVTLIGSYLSTAERCEALVMCPRTALVGNVMTVPAALTKDGKESPVVLPDWIAEKIRRLPVIEPRGGTGASPLIWPYPYAIDQLRVRYTEDVLKPAGLPTTRWHKFHALRRSAVTQVKISHGLEAAREMARHFSAGLTLEKYVSQSVVKQQTGTVSFHVPAPTKQLGLF